MLENRFEQVQKSLSRSGKKKFSGQLPKCGLLRLSLREKKIYVYFFSTDTIFKKRNLVLRLFPTYLNPSSKSFFFPVSFICLSVPNLLHGKISDTLIPTIFMLLTILYFQKYFLHANRVYCRDSSKIKSLLHDHFY